MSGETANSEKAKELILQGGEIAGTAVGGALGFIADGPGGAAAGAVGGLLLSKAMALAAEFAFRQLSRREKERVGGSLAFALAKIEQHLAEGDMPRNDGFFHAEQGERSASDEILEGVLFRCKNEHEEKKIRLLANIYANTAFMPEVSPAGANWLLQQAQELTYRQMCILSLVKQTGVRSASWGPRDGDPAFEMEYKSLESMFARDRSPEALRSYQETGARPSIIRLSRIGELCYKVMGLGEIPEDDLRQLAPRFPRAFERG